MLLISIALSTILSIRTIGKPRGPLEPDVVFIQSLFVVIILRLAEVL